MDPSTIPACDATGPDGARLVIRPHATTDAVADLARALDLPIELPLIIDGREAPPHQPLVASGLRIGSAIAAPAAPSPSRPDPPCSPDPPAGGLEVAVVAGPSCGPWRALAEGRHTVGRASSADVHVDDPTVELHHAVIDVAADGSAAVTQLTGPCLASIDGAPVRPRQPLAPGQTVELGTSRLEVRHSLPRSPTSPSRGSLVTAPGDPWRSVLQRGPRVDAAPATPVPDLPDPPPPHRGPPLTSLVGAGVAAAGAGLLALVIGHALFALFAAVGAAASLATWSVGAWTARRDRRRADARHRTARTRFEEALTRVHADAERAHLAQHPAVVDALDVLRDDLREVWSRRLVDEVPMYATVGRGTCVWTPEVAPGTRDRLDAELLVALGECERLVDVPVPFDVDPSSVTALHGARTITEALARSVIVQLAVSYGPADWELVVVSDEPDRWSWTTWLPHSRGRDAVGTSDAAGLSAALGGDPAGGSTHGGRRLVVVLAAPRMLTERTGVLRRRLGHGDVACIVVVPEDASVPAIAGRMLEVGATATARWIATDRPWDSADRHIHVAGLSAATAEAAARRLAPLVDPEDHDEAAGIPATVSLADIEPIAADTAAVIARRWRNAGRDPAPIARLGRSAEGAVDVDLVRHGPHGLIAGTTGSGKSELLRTLVVSLAARTSPDHLALVLVDFKGGSTFDACARLPHTVGVVTDLDDGLAERMLVSLDAEIRRRERALRAAGVDDLPGYRRAVDEPLPRLVVVIDEFASLVQQSPGFLSALVAVAQRGRSLGVHLLLATQRPAGVVTDDIRANTNLRIALRVHDRRDALDVVGDDAPARFSRALPGQAALRLDADDLVVFQSATTSSPVVGRPPRLTVERVGNCSNAPGPCARGPTVLTHLVAAIEGAAEITGIASPHRPWTDALPRVLAPGDLRIDGSRIETEDDGRAVGLIDDPENQRRGVLRWAPGDGTLLLVGAVGSGTTTTAVAVAASCARAADPSGLHLYVIDAHGDPAWSAVAALPHCGGVVRTGETERLDRLLARLTGEIDRRSAHARRTPPIVLVIDGIAAVRDALVSADAPAASMRLDRVLRDGPSVGVVAVLATDGSSASVLALSRANTWVFHVDDVATARAAGLRAAPVPAGIPGRLRVAGSGLEAQVALDPDPCAGLDVPEGAGPAPVGTLPEFVTPEQLDASPAPERLGAGLLGLTLGLGADDLEPAVLRVPAGDHLFIGGAARTGRSTALRQVEAAWSRLHPDGQVIRIHAGPAVLIDLDGDGPVLVTVDDADRVDDPEGRLDALVASRRPALTIAVAVRLESVRSAYGHWTREVARSRCGLIMTSVGDVDGELLGATLPRRSVIPPRPGLAWMVDHEGPRLVQVAARLQT